MTNQQEGTSMLYALLAEARNYPDAILLGRGDPDFDTPPHIIEAAQEAMIKHGNDFTPSEGILPLRQAIAERVKRINNIDLDPETEIVVTNGGQEALLLMVLTVISPGDEMLGPDPNYNTYYDALNFAGGIKVAVSSHVEDNFQIDPERMKAAITDRTRAMLLVSPNNPSGSVIPRDNVRRLVEIAQEHDLIILADDIYDQFVYDGYEHVSPASLPGGKERTLTLNALSKTYAMTGWRVGWLTGPADLMVQVKQLKAAMTGATSIVAQHAALAALTGPQDAVNEMYQTYLSRRRTVLDALESMGLPCGPSQGGQFIFANISSTGLSSGELAQRLVTEQHVVASPGIVFTRDKEWDNYIRITFLQPEETLREGLRRFKAVVDTVSTTG
jgi:aminotransferase